MLETFTKAAEDTFHLFGGTGPVVGGCGSCNSMTGGKRRRKPKTKKRKTKGKKTYKRRGKSVKRRRRRRRGGSVSYQATPVGIGANNSALANPMQISKN